VTARHPRRVVLGYHAVGPWHSNLVVSEDALRRQVARFAEGGFTGLTVTESERRLREGTLPPRTVVFTFDDGFRTMLRAKAILDDAGYPATAFVVTGFADGRRPLHWYGLRSALGESPASLLQPITWDEAAELAAGGWEIGSHTVTHPLLSNLPRVDLLRELEESRQAVAAQFGRCDSVAYPYGVPDATVAAAAAQLGYRSGWVLTGAHVTRGPFLRPRLGVVDADVGLRLRVQTSAAGLLMRRSPLAAAIRSARHNRPWLPPG
jgi:peptidoglycan/xylan/chitin deacetylase (PgdA/CDA1 family)